MARGLRGRGGGLGDGGVYCQFKDEKQSEKTDFVRKALPVSVCLSYSFWEVKIFLLQYITHIHRFNSPFEKIFFPYKTQLICFIIFL